jgi:hypothetical protein
MIKVFFIHTLYIKVLKLHNKKKKSLINFIRDFFFLINHKWSLIVISVNTILITYSKISFGNFSINL